jgi:hypothetical protein
MGPRLWYCIRGCQNSGLLSHTRCCGDSGKVGCKIAKTNFIKCVVIFRSNQRILADRFSMVFCSSYLQFPARRHRLLEGGHERF